MKEEKLFNLIGCVDSKYIEEANSTKKGHLLRWCALAACLALCIYGAFAAYAAYQTYNTEVSYVCLDVNPSFELCLNHENTIVNVIAYNEDGKEMLNKLDCKGKHYKEVIDGILHHADFQKYLTQDLTITIVSKDDAEIQKTIEDCMEKAQCNGKVVCSDAQSREAAYSNHCSVGKYIVYEELSQYDEGVTLEDCKNMTMHEIYEQIDKHHNAHHNNVESADAETTEATQPGHHSEHHSNHH